MGVVTQTAQLPDYAKPYVQDMLAQTQAYTDVNANPYQQFQGERVAGFTDLQKQAFQGAQNMQPSAYNTQGAGIAGLAANQALAAGQNFQPGQFANQFNAPDQYQSGQFAAQQANAPSLQTYQMQAPGQVGFERAGTERVSAPTMQGASGQYNANLQNYQMGPAERLRTQSFLQPGAADAYMSPYMQNVVDVQKREAARQSGIQGTQQQAQATQAGAFGGSRDAIMRAERERNLGQQMGDIQATGSQASYQQAQQQFNAEQAARLQAGQANQQAGLTVGGQNLAANLGVQQLGTGVGAQFGLASLSNQQQAAVQNQAAQLQTQGMNSQQALQAALANQQAGMQSNQFNAQMGYNVGQQNLQAQLGTQQFGAGQNLQAQLANQQTGMQAQQLGEQSRQFGAGQGMTAAQQAAQFGQQATQLGEQSRQYGAGLGLQGANTALQGASTLGTLGNQQFGQQKDISGMQYLYGAAQQQNQQLGNDVNYQNFMAAQNYPKEQLSFRSNMLNGLPMGSTTTNTPDPSALSQGIGLLGAASTFANPIKSFLGFAKGGAVADRGEPGLMALMASRYARG